MRPNTLRLFSRCILVTSATHSTRNFQPTQKMFIYVKQLQQNCAHLSQCKATGVRNATRFMHLRCKRVARIARPRGVPAKYPPYSWWNLRCAKYLSNLNCCLTDHLFDEVRVKVWKISFNLTDSIFCISMQNLSEVNVCFVGKTRNMHCIVWEIKNYFGKAKCSSNVTNPNLLDFIVNTLPTFMFS